jgi:hypothetical protein
LRSSARPTASTSPRPAPRRRTPRATRSAACRPTRSTRFASAPPATPRHNGPRSRSARCPRACRSRRAVLSRSPPPARVPAGGGRPC